LADVWKAVPWIVVAAVVIVILPVVAAAYFRYRKSMSVRCPETGTDAEIQVDASHAARTSFPGPPDLRVQTCSHWPEREPCDEECLRLGETDASV
jgi:hypothetical protein